MRGPHRGRRTACALGAVALLLVAVGLNPARAEPAPAPFGNGTAAATAIVTRFTPGVGSLPTGLFGGVALTNVTNSVAQAQAETLDLGLIGDLLVALDLVDSESLPGPLAVDNRGGEASAEADEVPIAGSTLGVGRKEVHATRVPGAAATSTFASSYGDVLRVEAARAESSSTIDPGRARQASASVSVDVDVAGLVHLSGLRWEAVHRSGEGARADGSFRIDGATVGGVAVPVGSLDAVEAAANAALAPLGISLQLPEVVHETEPNDLVRVTSLRVRMADTPAGKAALGPVLGLTREQRQQLFDALSAIDDSLGAALLAADVATSILSGSGFLSIEVGGVEATSGALPEENPFGSGSGSGSPSSGPSPSLPPAAPGPDVVGGVPGLVAAPVLPDLGPSEDRCASSHLRHPIGCSDGALLPVGLGGLAAAAGIAILDVRHQRRSRAAPRLAATTPGGSAILAGRTLRSYLPVAVVGAGFVLLAASASVPRAHVALDRDLEVPNVVTPALGPDGAPIPGPVGDGGADGGGAGGAGTPAGSAGGVRPCADRVLQVTGDPYSPPCYAFSGDNGGATSVGVSGDAITVSVREVEAGSATDIFAGLSSQEIDSSSESVEQTLEALAEYFSKHFQMYGRHLEIEYFRGTGNGITELLGGGKEEALADAVRASKELGAFADLSGITIPYSDSLARNGVVNFGAPYPSQKWYLDHRPYSWSLFSDGTNVVSATSSAMIGRYPPGSRAEHAGAALRDHPRRFAVVAPENAEYQESMNVLIDRLRSADIDVAMNLKYKLDLASFPNQASNLVAQLKDAGVTSVVCICDPAMLAFGLTPKANEQDYEPEWITAGLVFVDQDVVAQSMDQRQWAHAFGTAYNAISEPIHGSYPYFAYKEVRPDDEPVVGVEELYYQMYLLAIGVQMAGPHLTPETFERGMFAYPSAFGPRGTWDFGPGDYTPTNDYREIWWDPARRSKQNDLPGAWAQLGNGRRWSPQHPPSGRAPFFAEG